MNNLMEKATKLIGVEREEAVVKYYRFHLLKISELQDQIRKHKICLEKSHNEVWESKQMLIEQG